MRKQYEPLPVKIYQGQKAFSKIGHFTALWVHLADVATILEGVSAHANCAKSWKFKGFILQNTYSQRYTYS